MRKLYTWTFKIKLQNIILFLINVEDKSFLTPNRAIVFIFPLIGIIVLNEEDCGRSNHRQLEPVSNFYMDRVKRNWYLSPMRAAKVQASLRIRAVSPEPPLLAHTSIESRGTFRQKTRSLALLNCWACAVKICHDGMLEDTNSLDGAHI